MNRSFVLEIAGLAVSLANLHLSGDSRQDLKIGDMLLEIIRMGVQAYEEHTGEPLDPALIKAEEPI